MYLMLFLRLLVSCVDTLETDSCHNISTFIKFLEVIVGMFNKLYLQFQIIMLLKTFF